MGASKAPRVRGWRLAVTLLVAAALGSCGDPTSPGPSVPDGLPSASGPLALSPDGSALWVVNPDAGSVTAVDTRTLRAAAPRPVGAEPWSIAITPTGDVLVANKASGSLSVLSDGRRTDLALGAEPAGLALSPTGRYAFVALVTSEAVAVVDLGRLEVLGLVSVGPWPWAIAVTDDGDADDLDESVVVAHRLARLRPGGAEGRDDGKEGWVTRVPLSDLAEAAAKHDDLPASATTASIGPYDFGHANGLDGLALYADRLYVAHLLNSPEFPRDFETTVSAAITSVPLVDDPAGGGGLRLHLNDESFSTPVNHPTGVAVSPDGLSLYVTLGGSDAVMGIDLSAPGGPELIGFWPTGSNPRGIVLSPDGSRAYVMNYLSRDVSVLDLNDRVGRSELARVPVVGETLPPAELRGKVLFHNAASARLSRLGWIACATCHLGGGSDGTTWQTPDGPRQTMPLWELAGTAPFHASATRDEVQDFERDIEELMAGSGLAPGAYRVELGEPNGGLSADLDALAEYVLHGIRVPAAPPVAEDLAVAGRVLFADLGCAACHGGSNWTISRLPGPVGSLGTDGVQVTSALRDVGTYDATADVLGADGFDVPTLLGLHATAPYLHDGSAHALADVLGDAKHVGRDLEPGEVEALTEFLLSIDTATTPF